MEKDKGLLIIICAPSGTGKGAIIKKYLEKHPETEYSVSCTTRTQRQNDIPGITYNFLTNEEFFELVNNKGLFEYEEYCGNYYGTPKRFIMDNIENNKDVILEIEYKGALNIKSQFSDSVAIFALPPTYKDLKFRLESRATDNCDKIKERLEKSKEEVASASKFDYLLINDNLDEVVNTLEAIIQAERCKINKHIKFINNFFEEVN